MEYEILKQRSKNLAYEVTSLKKCEDEPIAFCGAIQPSGLLLAVDAESLEIRAASANWTEATDFEAKSILGKKLSDIATLTPPPKDPKTICADLTAGKLQITINGVKRALTDGSCSKTGPNLIIEFEFEDEVFKRDNKITLKNFISAARVSETIEEVADETAKVIREMSGIDRVMIYRFDNDWNGEVIAEAKSDFLDPFLHLKYPSYDIPPQARRLFFENQSRMIVRMDAEAVPVLTNGFHPGELDLSYALLRAVSPIHIQYLLNMGVSASFSAPIRVSEKLWGLIACHHYSGIMHPAPETRYIFELASQIASSKITDLIERRRLQIKNETLTFTQMLLSDVASGKSVMQALRAQSDALLNLTHAPSAYIRIGGESSWIGEPINPATLPAMLDHIQQAVPSGIWKSNSLSKTIKVKPDPKAAGAMVVPLSITMDDVLIWFRPEEIQEVRWGGKPQDKEASHKGTLERLSPRSSFAEWTEKLENHSRLWSESDVEFAQYFQIGFVQGLFEKARALSTANLELERVAKSKDEFIGTVSHELRTPLSIIVGWINILKDFEQPDPEATEAVNVIERNAKVQIKLIDDLLDASRIIAGKLRLNLEPSVLVDQLVTNVVEGLVPTAQAKSIHLTVQANHNVRLPVDPDRIRQVVWNLLTNAIKFTPKGGTVSVNVEAKSSSCVITVQDSGMGIDPAKLSMIFDRFAQARAQSAEIGGLGLGLSIVKSIVELHGGRVQAFSEGDGTGTKFVVTLPVYALAHPQEPAMPARRTETKVSHSSRLANLRILIVEDQPDSVRALKILLERESAIVTTATNGAEGLSALKLQKFDLVLSDIGMPMMDGNEMMKTWREEETKYNIPHTPAIALTAYATSKDRTQALMSGFQNHISKPIDHTELLAVIDSVGAKPAIPSSN